MAKIIYSSGQVGKKATKADAENVVKELIGNIDASLLSDRGYNHWNYLKAMVSRYAEIRGLQNEFVIKGYPFNWLTHVDSKCSAVLLRKNYNKGEHRVEPEMFLEVGLLSSGNGKMSPGISAGFHYLDGIDNDSSVFIKELRTNKELEMDVCNIVQSGLVGLNNGHSSSVIGTNSQKDETWKCPDLNRALNIHWNVNSTLIVHFEEKDIPNDLDIIIFRVFDELMPFYKKITSLMG